jgi:hypothetical protein
MEWSRPVIALFSLVIFAVAFWVAWGNKDAQTFSILVGAIVSLVSSVAGYYFGSSAGSQKKDDVIHAALMTAQGTPPRRQEADRPAGDTYHVMPVKAHDLLSCTNKRTYAGMTIGRCRTVDQCGGWCPLEPT